MAQGKRLRDAYKDINRDAFYSVTDAVHMIKERAKAKFDETIEISLNLGVDPRHADQAVRGVIQLPQGTGKTLRVAVFAKGDRAQQAKDAGADIVGFEDLASDIKGGKIDFDVVIAAPDAMRVVGQLGQILGPRGLMPNPKVGTVTQDVATAIKNAKAGQIQYRADKAGIVQCTIGRASFSVDALVENLKSLVDAVNKSKPSGVKGIFLKKISVSSTMGAGVRVDQASLLQQ
jgi:large subunit ribosomal protein L1